MNIFRTPTDTSLLYNPSILNFCLEDINKASQDSGIADEDQTPYGKECNAVKASPTELKQKKNQKTCNNVIGGTESPKNMSFWNWNKYVAFVGYASVPSENAGRSKYVNKQQPSGPVRNSKGPHRNTQDQKISPGQTEYATYTCPDAQYGIQTRGSSCASTFGSTSGSESYTDDASSLSYSLSCSTYSSFISAQTKSSCTVTSSVSSITSSSTPSTDMLKHKQVHPISSSSADQNTKQISDHFSVHRSSNKEVDGVQVKAKSVSTSAQAQYDVGLPKPQEIRRKQNTRRCGDACTDTKKSMACQTSKENIEEREKALAKQEKQLKGQHMTKIDDERKQKREEDWKEKEKQRKEREKKKKEEAKLKEKEKKREEKEKKRKEEEKQWQKKAAEREKEREKRRKEKEQERKKEEQEKERKRKIEDQERRRKKRRYTRDCRRSPASCDCEDSPSGRCEKSSPSGGYGISEKAPLSRKRSQSRWRKDRQYRRRRKGSRERRRERGDRREREERERCRDRRGSGYITGDSDCSPSYTGEAHCRGRKNLETGQNLGLLDSFLSVQLFPKKRRGPSNVPNKVYCNDSSSASSNAFRNSSYYSLSCSSTSATSSIDNQKRALFDDESRCKIPKHKSNFPEQKKINISDSPELQHNKNRQSSKKPYCNSEIQLTLLQEGNCPHCHQFKSKNKSVPLPKDCPAYGKKKGILSLEERPIQSRSSMYSNCSTDRSLRVIRCKHGRRKSQCELCSAVRLAVMHTYNPNQVHGKHISHSQLYSVNCSTDWSTHKRRCKHKKDPNECELCLLYRSSARLPYKHKCKHGNRERECDLCLLHRSSDRLSHRHKCKHGNRKTECERCLLHLSSDRLTHKHQCKHGYRKRECELCLLHRSSDGLAHKYKCQHGKQQSRCQICSTRTCLNGRSEHEDASQHRKHRRDQHNIYGSSITYLVDRVASEYESRHGSHQSQNNLESFSTCSDGSDRTENMYICKHGKDPDQCKICCLAAVGKIPHEHKYKHEKHQCRCKFCSSVAYPVTHKCKCKHGTYQSRCKLCVLGTYPADRCKDKQRCKHDNHPSTCALCCAASNSTDKPPHIPVSVKPIIQCCSKHQLLCCSKHKKLSSFSSPSKKSDNDYSVKSFDGADGKLVSLDSKIPKKIKQPKLYICHSDYEPQPEAQGDANIQKQNNKPNYQRNLHDVPTYHQVCDLSVCTKRQKTEEYQEPTSKLLYSCPTPSSSISAKPCSTPYTLPFPKPRSKLSISDTTSKSSKPKVISKGASNISVCANPSVCSASKAKPQNSAISMANKTRNSGDNELKNLFKIKSNAAKSKAKCKKRKSHISVCTRPSKTKTIRSDAVPKKASNTSTYREENPETRTSNSVLKNKAEKRNSIPKQQAVSNTSSSSSSSDTTPKSSKSKARSKDTSNISVSGNPSVCSTSTVHLKTCKAKPKNSVISMSNKTRKSGKSIFKKLFKMKTTTEKLKADCKKRKSHISVCTKPNNTKTRRLNTVPKTPSNTSIYLEENSETRTSNSVLKNKAEKRNSIPKQQAVSNTSSSSSSSDTTPKSSKSKARSKGKSNISVRGNPSVCFTSTVHLETSKAKPQNSVISMANKTRKSGESRFKKLFKIKSSTEKLKAKCKKRKSPISVCTKPNKTKTRRSHKVPKMASSTSTYLEENPETRTSHSTPTNISKNKPTQNYSIPKQQAKSNISVSSGSSNKMSNPNVEKVRSNIKQTSKEKESIRKARSSKSVCGTCSKSISKISKSCKKTYNAAPIEKTSVKPKRSIISSKLQKSKEKKKSCLKETPKKSAQLKSYKNNKNKQSSETEHSSGLQSNVSVKSLPRLLYSKLIKKNKIKSKSSKSLQSTCSQTCTPKNSQKILSSLFPGPCEVSVTKNRTSGKRPISVPSATKQSSISPKTSVSSKESITKSTPIPRGKCKADKRKTCGNKVCRSSHSTARQTAVTTKEGKSPKLNSSQISTSRGVISRKPIKKHKKARANSQKISTKEVKLSKSSQAVVCGSPKLSCKAIKQVLCSPINVLARCGGINSPKGIKENHRKERSHTRPNQSNLVLYLTFEENKLKSWTNTSLSSKSCSTSSLAKLKIAGQKYSPKTSTTYEYSKGGKRKKGVQTKPVNKSKLSNKKPNPSNPSKTIEPIKKQSTDWSTVQTSDENPEKKDLKDKGTSETKSTGYFSKSSISFVCGPFSSNEKLNSKKSLVNKTSSEPLVNEKCFGTENENCVIWLEEDNKENKKNKNRKTVTDKDSESLLGTVRGKSDQSTCTWPNKEKSDSQIDKKSSKENIISEKASEKELKAVAIIHSCCQTDFNFETDVREKVDKSNAKPDERQEYDKGDTKGYNYNVSYEKATTPKEIFERHILPEEYSQRNFSDADSTKNNKQRICVEQNNNFVNDSNIKEKKLRVNKFFCNSTKTTADDVLKSNNTPWRSPNNYSCELSRTWLDESLKRDDKMYIVTCSRKAKPIKFKKMNLYNVDFVTKMRPNYELSHPPSKSIGSQISYKHSSSSDIHTDTSSEKIQPCVRGLCKPLLNCYSNSTSGSQDDCNNKARRVFSDGSIRRNSDVFVTSSDSSIKPSSQSKSFMVTSNDFLPELIRAGMEKIRWPERGVRKNVSESSSVNEIYVTVASNQSRPFYKQANAAVGALESRDSNIIELKRELPCRKLSVHNLFQNFQANMQMPYKTNLQKQKQPLIENANVSSLTLETEENLWSDVNMQRNARNTDFPNKKIRYGRSGNNSGNANCMQMSREAKLQKEIPTHLNPSNSFISEEKEEEVEEEEEEKEEKDEEGVWSDEYVQWDSSDFYSKQDMASSNEPVSRKSVKWKSEYEPSKTIYTETSSDNNKSQPTQTFVLIPNTSSEKLQTETSNKMTHGSVYETSSQTDLCDLETQTSGVEAPASTINENGENSDQHKRSNTIKRIYHYCSCGQMMKIDVIKHFD